MSLSPQYRLVWESDCALLNMTEPLLRVALSRVMSEQVLLCANKDKIGSCSVTQDFYYYYFEPRQLEVLDGESDSPLPFQTG